MTPTLPELMTAIEITEPGGPKNWRPPAGPCRNRPPAKC